MCWEYQTSANKRQEYPWPFKGSHMMSPRLLWMSRWLIFKQTQVAQDNQFRPHCSELTMRWKFYRADGLRSSLLLRRLYPQSIRRFLLLCDSPGGCAHKRDCGSLVEDCRQHGWMCPQLPLFCSWDQGVQHVCTSFFTRILGYVLDWQSTMILHVSFQIRRTKKKKGKTLKCKFVTVVILCGPYFFVSQK